MPRFKAPYLSALKIAFLNDPRTKYFPQISDVFSEALFVLEKEIENSTTLSLTSITNYYDKLQYDSRKIIYFGERLDNNTKIIQNAKNSYLNNLGYKSQEEVLLIYDNTMFGTGEKGFTLTTKGFYSTGCPLTNGRFFISIDDIDQHDITIKGSDLVINGKHTDINKTAWATRNKVESIIRCFIDIIPVNTQYTVHIPSSTIEEK